MAGQGKARKTHPETHRGEYIKKKHTQRNTEKSQRNMAKTQEAQTHRQREETNQVVLEVMGQGEGKGNVEKGEVEGGGKSLWSGEESRKMEREMTGGKEKG